MAIRGGLIWKIVNSVCQGNFTFAMKKPGIVWEFKKPVAVATMHSHFYWKKKISAQDN